MKSYRKKFNWSQSMIQIEFRTQKNVLFEKTKVLSGADFVLLRKPFRKKIKIPVVKVEIESVFITVGGDDKLNLTPKILELLNQNYPNWKKQILIGPSFKNLEQITKYQNENDYSPVYPDTRL